MFSEVEAGQDVVDTIEKVRTGRVGFYSDVPLEAVVIESVDVEE